MQDYVTLHISQTFETGKSKQADFTLIVKISRKSITNHKFIIQ